MSTPDHVENTGDNLRHAAEAQQEAREAKTAQVPAEQSAEVPLPDFNS